MRNIGYSSEIYHIQIKDLISLPNSELPYISDSNEAILLIGNEKKHCNDSLLHGRSLLESALKNGLTHYPVKIAFQQRMTYAHWLGIIKPIRKKYLAYSMNSYEIVLSDIINNHLERNIKTSDTAYNYTNRKYRVPEENRLERFNNMKTSFAKNGFNKNYPLAIMLCRSFGVKDKLHQGHHRMVFCKLFNIKYVQVRFLACSSITGIMKNFFLWLNKTLKYKQVS